MRKEYSIWIVSIVSLLLSVIAVCVAVWRSPDLDFDYQGVLVGVLSLLVTVLVGLNIYTLVDFRNKESMVDEKIKLITESLSNLSRAELSTSATTEHASCFPSCCTSRSPMSREPPRTLWI